MGAKTKGTRFRVRLEPSRESFRVEEVDARGRIVRVLVADVRRATADAIKALAEQGKA